MVSFTSKDKSRIESSEMYGVELNILCTDISLKGEWIEERCDTKLELTQRVPKFGSTIHRLIFWSYF